MGETTSTSRRALIIWAFRLTGSAAFLAVVFYLLPLDGVIAAAQRLDPIYWIFALVIFLVGHAIAAMKWRLLINRSGEVAIFPALRAHMTGLAANLCLPGVAGGDVFRAGLVMRSGGDKARIAFGSVLDRLIDVIGLAFLAAIGAAFIANANAGSSALVKTLLALGALGVMGVGGYLLIRKLNFPLIKKITTKIDSLIVDLAREPGRVGLCLLLSMTVQSTFIATTIMLAHAAAAEASAAEWFFAWPLAKIIAIAPVSLAGLGVREASLAAILGGLGANPQGVVAASLLWQSVLFAGGAIGGVFMITTKAPQPHDNGADSVGHG